MSESAPWPAHPSPDAGGGTNESGSQKEASAAPDAVASPEAAPGQRHPRSAKSSSMQAGINITGSVTDSQIHITTEIKDALIGSASADSRFSRFLPKEMGITVSRESEQESARQYAYDQTFVNTCLGSLRQSRVLLLVGEPSSGKESMARYLAHCLRGEEGLGQDTLILTPPLSSEVRVNLFAALRDDTELEQRVVVFLDAFERSNSGLANFASGLRRETLADLTRHLSIRRTFVILTAVPASMPLDCLKSLPPNLHPTIPPLSQSLRQMAIRGRIADLLAEHLDTTLAKYSVDELSMEIAKRTGTVSQAVRFVNSNLLEVLREETPFDHAFDRMDSQSTWFQSSADGPQREAWIFALALVIAHSLGRDCLVPWNEFHDLYVAIRRRLTLEKKGEFESSSFGEEQMLAAAGAETGRDYLNSRDYITFREPGAARRLWEVLLSKFKAVAKSVAPVLIDLTKRPSAATRSRAAQALGRIGWLDAEDMTGHWAIEWADSNKFAERALAGYLAEGAFSMADEAYKQTVLNLLDRLARRDDRVWTAIAAYKQIGRIAPEIALQRLEEIARRLLAPAFEQSRESEAKLESLDRELQRIRSNEAEFLRHVLAVTGTYFHAAFQKRLEIADSLRYALVSLSLTTGMGPILEALARWTTGSLGMGAVVCYVFLMNDGLASEMARRRVMVKQAAGKWISCNAAVGTMMDDPKAIQSVVKFLRTMYASLVHFFPLETAALLTHLMYDLLEEWVKDSLGESATRKVMVELIGRLLRTNLVELQERTFDWLSAGSEFISNREMAAFARDCRAYVPPR